jgi:hypothetical protein
LLIATKPALPRPNAICAFEPVCQLVSAAAPTAARNCAMFAIAAQRCWQLNPFEPPVPEHEPAPAQAVLISVRPVREGPQGNVPPLGAPSSLVLNW